jgi:hypothetical protein
LHFGRVQIARLISGCKTARRSGHFARNRLSSITFLPHEIKKRALAQFQLGGLWQIKINLKRRVKPYEPIH